MNNKIGHKLNYCYMVFLSWDCVNRKQYPGVGSRFSCLLILPIILSSTCTASDREVHYDNYRIVFLKGTLCTRHLAA